MLKKLKHILINLSGPLGIINGGHLGDSKEESVVERSLVTSLSIVGIIFSGVSLVINFLWNLSVEVRFLAGVSFITYLVIYYLSRKKKNKTFYKWLIIVVTIIFINASWYFDYKSQGAMLYLLLLLYSYLILVLANKQLFFATLLIIVNIGALYFLEYAKYVPPISGPGDVQLLMVDKYIGLAVYLIVAYGLMKIVKENYLNEYYKAKESDRLKTSFLANISHEIRTPLNAIVGFSNLMLTDDVTSDERKQYKAIINTNNKFLLELVNDILDISMIESNSLQLEEKQINLNALVSDMELTYSEILKKQGKDQVELKTSVPKEDVLITIDGSYLLRALGHLLDNAVKFTDKGLVTFGFSVDSKMIRFHVKDTGIGIKEKDVAHLFERFNKLEYSKEKIYSGTGIGLYLVKLIIEMFGGTVSAESTFGEGSEFIFTIPAKELKITK